MRSFSDFSSSLRLSTKPLYNLFSSSSPPSSNSHFLSPKPQRERTTPLKPLLKFHTHLQWIPLLLHRVAPVSPRRTTASPPSPSSPAPATTTIATATTTTEPSSLAAPEASEASSPPPPPQSLPDPPISPTPSTTSSTPVPSARSPSAAIETSSCTGSFQFPSDSTN